jgi:hypothetical protein
VDALRPPRPRPELPVLLLEDSGALVGLTIALLGVGLTVVTSNGIFDGVASLCIGCPARHDRRSPGPGDHQPAHR